MCADNTVARVDDVVVSFVVVKERDLLRVYWHENECKHVACNHNCNIYSKVKA